MYKIKRFSLTEINYSDVVKYIQSNGTDLGFSTILRNKCYSPGVYINNLQLFKDDYRINKIIDVISHLVKSFRYQLIFAFINNEVIKFDLDKLIHVLSDGIPKTIRVFMQPTIRVRIDRMTEYRTNDILFHFTSYDNLDSILINGLIPKGRSQGKLGYNYPPSVHLLTSLNHMVKFENGKIIGANKWKENLIGFKINNSGKYKFIQDPAFDAGIISYHAINPRDIELIDESEYEYLFNKYSIKNYEMFDDKLFIGINEIR